MFTVELPQERVGRAARSLHRQRGVPRLRRYWEWRSLVVETPLHFRRSAMIRWEGWKNTIWYCPARLNGRKVFLHDWKTRPRSRLEIVADIKLRDAFGLTDGDPVEVWIPSEYLAHVGHLSRWQRFKLDHQATWEAVAKVLRQLNTGLRFPSTRRPGDADAG